MSRVLSTYRLQFSSEYTFSKALPVIEYLHRLGISHIYASPVLSSRKGSTHGYDVVDPTKIDPELGEQKDLMKLISEIQKLEMGWIQDIVPNHMAYSSENKMLYDVLENGPFSQYYNFFDINWESQYENMRGKVLAPFLGKFYSECLENAELQLNYQKSGLNVHYYQHFFPIRIESYPAVFGFDTESLQKALGRKHPDFVKYLGVLNAMKNISIITDIQERSQQISFIKEMLWELYSGNHEIRKNIESILTIFNGTAGEPESFDHLFKLMQEQYYRLSFWKVGTEEINYRRFFNVNELISLRIEDEEVFQTTHKLILDFIKNGAFDGLRIDHVDGLADPTNYLNRLRRAVDKCYILVEKILEYSENLPLFWPVQGTTGYDFLNFMNGIYCDRQNEAAMDRIYIKFIGKRVLFSEMAYEKKRLIVGKHMAGDVDNLAHLLVRILSQYRYGSDFTLYGLRRSLVEILSHFEIYRTYISEENYRDEDRDYIIRAINKSITNMPDFENELLLIQRILLMQSDSQTTAEETDQWYQFIYRFQQLTGPLMAKGFEDTVLYNYNRFISHNEVGGNPGKFGISGIEFHYFNKRKAERWPEAMNATSTHDAKRGEDVRARLNVLSEIPEEWGKYVRLWSKLNRKKKMKTGTVSVPDLNDEYFLYQTLVGSFPQESGDMIPYRNRIKEYSIKAVREAKVHTAWLKPDTEYESSYELFIDRIMDDSTDNIFLKEFLPFQKKISWYGMLNSLSQVILKCTSPGIPDFYQGSELWDLNLVDPDNRRPVDYRKRKQFLKDIEKKYSKDKIRCINDLFDSWTDGRIKMFLIRQLLHARREYHQLFQKGNYIPLEFKGSCRRHVKAFARQFENNVVIVAVPRFFTELIPEKSLPLAESVWNNTHLILPLQLHSIRNLITGEQID
ncbi:MAG: malto-oligosyltrehalose synthase, partial [Calditrichaeota bacterium]